MRKISFLIVLALFSVAAQFAATTIGVFGGYPSTGLTFSIDRVEAQIAASYNTNSGEGTKLFLSADYSIIHKGLTLGSTSGFFWNFGVGPYLDMGSDFDKTEVGILAPLEFGYNIPKLLDNRFDVYTQLSLGTAIVPSPGFVWGLGIGVRVRL